MGIDEMAKLMRSLHELVLRTLAVRALAVRPWRTQGCLLYLVALLHLPSFFRFVVLV
jgi:hypothetical protein